MNARITTAPCALLSVGTSRPGWFFIALHSRLGAAERV